MSDEERDDPTLVFIEGDAKIIPLAPKPEPTQRPAGAIVWLTLLGVAAALEVVALAAREFGWTLSHAVWWAQGPEGGVRWWLLGLPLFGLVQWASWHFLIGPRVDGWFLVGAVLVCLTLGIGGVLLR